ncbi:MAG: CoA transferase, partial [Pyramidobacter sp.]|nr:CoA transferase [Pyramidobacter sp.]
MNMNKKSITINAKAPEGLELLKKLVAKVDVIVENMGPGSMDRLGLTGLAGKCYRELSGGQQQRVLLARALCATRKLLMLDEPVTGLDPNATAGMYDLIASLNGEGVTVVMISHDLSAAERHASHILHLTGHGWFFGTREEYLSSDVRRRFAPAEGGER